MSRRFVNGEYLNYSGTTPFTLPGTLMAWYKPTDSTRIGIMMSMANSGTTPDIIWLDHAGTLSDELRFHYLAGDSASTSNAFVIGGWNCAIGTVDASLNQVAVLNGDWANRGTNVGTAVSGLDRTTIGALLDSTPYAVVDGDIAHCAIWGAVLDQGEIEALAAGASPLAIRPAALKFYLPMTGASTGAEMDVIGGLSLTQTGTIDSAESPLLALGQPISVTVSTAAVGGLSIPISAYHYNHNTGSPL